MLHHKKMLFLGGGNIAGAVACGLVNSNAIPADFITVYDIDGDKLNKFAALGINVTNDISAIPTDVEYMFLAVKPGIVKIVLRQLSSIEFTNKSFTIVSFAASVTIDHIIKSFGREVPVIRTMPSTPILVGEGVLAVSRNNLVSPQVFEYFCRTMSSVAHVTTIDESLMNPIISVHGSSPAYVYLFIKSMIDAAEQQGIAPELSIPLILKTIKGSVTMVEKSDKPIEELIANVASPNGTTLAALQTFYDNNFSSIIADAMTACTKRADEISAEL